MSRKSQPLLAFVSLLAAVVAFSGAETWAKPRKKKAKAPTTLETYSAMESEDPAPLVLSAASPQAASTEARSANSARTSAKKPKNWGQYYPLPADQTDSIASRLTWVEKLIREHRRAYDYRIHTAQELETIYRGLQPALPTPTELPVPDSPPPATDQE